MNELLVSKLKDARMSKGLKQQEVAEQLGLKANTISNWEKGKTEPDIDTFIKLCDIYQIDCASLLSDVYAFKRIKSDISLSEYEHIKKYRALDGHGKRIVGMVLDEEYSRIQQPDLCLLQLAARDQGKQEIVDNRANEFARDLSQLPDTDEDI